MATSDGVSRGTRRLNVPAQNTGTSAGGTGGGTGGRGSKQLPTGGGRAANVAGFASGAAGNVARDKVTGDGTSRVRKAAGTLAGGAVSGAVEGAPAGGAPGAAAGAVKGAAMAGAQGVVTSARRHGTREGRAELKQEKKQDEQVRRAKRAEKHSRNLKRAAKGGAAAAAPAIGTAVAAEVAKQALKQLLFDTAAFAANTARAAAMLVVSTAKSAFHVIATPFMAVGRGIAGVLGTVGVTISAPMVTLATGATAVVTTMALVAGVIVGAVDRDRIGDDGGRSSRCVLTSTGDSGDGDGADVSGDMETNAKAVYSALSDFGMNDENIAGILGNWEAESSIDPTSLEGVFGEPYQLGPSKRSALDSGFSGGIGLGQWTGSRNTMLRDYAKAKGQDWYTIETQVAFLIEGDNPGDVAIVKDMIEHPKPSAAEAATYYHLQWERSASTDSSGRVANAEKWYGLLSGWETDGSVPDGVRNIVGTMVDTLAAGVATVFGGCTVEDEEKQGDAGALAEGGMTEEDANALTDLYNQEGHDVLNAKFGGGGPGQCNGDYRRNCVSFSWYFVVKYTTYNGGYVAGNGVDVARNLGSAIGKDVSDKPSPYSIFSHGNSSAAGHTGVVLAVDGDRIMIGEAAYCEWDGARVRWVEPGEWQNAGWDFLDLSDMVSSDISDENR